MHITTNDIRFARPCDLAMLTGIDQSSFTAWTRQRKLTEQSIQTIASALNISPSEFLSAWELRRQDYEQRQQAIAKLQIMIAQR